MIGTSVSFNLTAVGALPLSYQWRFNGTNKAEATGTSLALSNVHAFGSSLGGNLLLRERDIYAGVVESDFVVDRVVLDVPEPWRVLPHLPGALRPGGWVAAYTPSIIQASQFVEAVRAERRYVQFETHEVLIRGWHMQGLAVRPQHEMVGHTGFVSVARLISESWEPGKPVRPA